MNYSEYTVADFLKDEHFIQWVNAPSPALDEYWRDWLNQFPDKTADLERARELLMLLYFEPDRPTRKDYLEVKSRIRFKIKELDENPIAEDTWWPFNGFRYHVAASIIFFLLCGTAYFSVYKFTYSELYYSTGYGEIESITLPDGSSVTLNANSEIRYSSGVFPSDKRKVDLRGEAFFSVKHTESNQKFIVCTNDGYRIEVLGTEFNVTNRKSEDRVVLHKGSIRLHLKGTEGETPVIMKPGELVQIAEESEGYTKKQVDPTVYTSWRNRKFVFHDQPLGEILLQLEDLYGVALTVPDSSLLEQTFTGSVPSQNIKVILSALEQSLDVKLIRKQK